MTEVLTTRADTSRQAARLLALVTAAGPPAGTTEPARLVEAFAELDLRNVTGDLDQGDATGDQAQRAADQVLLDLTRMIAADEETADEVAAAIELFQQVGLIEAAFERDNWTAARFLEGLRHTIDLLDDDDPDSRVAMKYARELADYSDRRDRDAIE